MYDYKSNKESFKKHQQIFEKNLGDYAYNSPLSMDAVNKGLIKLRENIISNYGRDNSEYDTIRSSFFTNSRENAAGQVGERVSTTDIDNIIPKSNAYLGDGNLREKMTAFMNAAYYNAKSKKTLKLFMMNNIPYLMANRKTVSQGIRIYRELEHRDKEAKAILDLYKNIKIGKLIEYQNKSEANKRKYDTKFLADIENLRKKMNLKEQDVENINNSIENIQKLKYSMVTYNGSINEKAIDYVSDDDTYKDFIKTYELVKDSTGKDGFLKFIGDIKWDIYLKSVGLTKDEIEKIKSKKVEFDDLKHNSKYFKTDSANELSKLSTKDIYEIYRKALELCELNQRYFNADIPYRHYEGDIFDWSYMMKSCCYEYKDHDITDEMVKQSELFLKCELDIIYRNQAEVVNAIIDFLDIRTSEDITDEQLISSVTELTRGEDYEKLIDQRKELIIHEIDDEINEARAKFMAQTQPDGGGIDLDSFIDEKELKKQCVEFQAKIFKDNKNHLSKLSKKGDKVAQWLEDLENSTKDIERLVVLSNISKRDRKKQQFDQNKLRLKDIKNAPLSEREKRYMHISDHAGPDTKLPWLTGRSIFGMDEKTAFCKLCDEKGLPLISGVSGTAARMIKAYKFLGLCSKKDLLNFRLALIGWMITSDDHSLYEILLASKIVGVQGSEDITDACSMDRNIDPLFEKEIRDNVCERYNGEGLFPDEICDLENKRDNDD